MMSFRSEATIPGRRAPTPSQGATLRWLECFTGIITVKQEGLRNCFTVMIPVKHPTRSIDSFEAGVVLGLLIGEGHFGGDGRQAQVTLRMHARHEPLLRWLTGRFPNARLYGPYHHGGRNYYQLMWRGTQLQYGLMPWLETLPWATLDPHSYARYRAMKERYQLEDVPHTEQPTLSHPRRDRVDSAN